MSRKGQNITRKWFIQAWCQSVVYACSDWLMPPVDSMMGSDATAHALWGYVMRMQHGAQKRFQHKIAIICEN